MCEHFSQRRKSTKRVNVNIVWFKIVINIKSDSTDTYLLSVFGFLIDMTSGISVPLAGRVLPLRTYKVS